MSNINRLRGARINQTLVDQADFFQVDLFTRVAGLTVVDVTTTLFFNNLVQPWTLTNGAPVTDSQVQSGFVYFHEISGSPGYYSLRLRPNAVGYWRLIVSYAAGQQMLSQDYDVIDALERQGGLSVSFASC